MRSVSEMEEVVISEDLPTAIEYIELRARAGWGRVDEDIAIETIQAAAFTICLRHNGRLVGLARVMGDGVLYFFLAEVIVDAAFRGGGHGDRLMRTVAAYFDRSAQPGATIVLIPLNGREFFYEKFGFVRCPDGPFGAGMHYAQVPPLPKFLRPSSDG
jgi:predicted GNAT family N-acyltransferase